MAPRSLRVRRNRRRRLLRDLVGRAGAAAVWSGRLGRRLIPPVITTVTQPTTANQKKLPISKAPWSTPTSPKLPSRPLLP